MAWDGILGAVDAAKDSKQQVVETEHLMKALVEQKDGLARRIFTKAGLDNTSLLQSTDNFISHQPKVCTILISFTYYLRVVFLEIFITQMYFVKISGRFQGKLPGLSWALTLLLSWRMLGNSRKKWVIRFCLLSI